jgi:hypothetical protein
VELSITLENPARAHLLFGPADQHPKMIREALARHDLRPAADNFLPGDIDTAC